MIRLRFDAELQFWFDEIYLLTIFIHSCTEIDAKMRELGAKMQNKLTKTRFSKNGKIKKANPSKQTCLFESLEQFTRKEVPTKTSEGEANSWAALLDST